MSTLHLEGEERLQEVKLCTQGHTVGRLEFKIISLTHALSPRKKILGIFVRKSSESFFVIMEQFCIMIMMMVIQI